MALLVVSAVDIGDAVGMLRVPRVPYGVGRSSTFMRQGITRAEFNRLVDAKALTRLRRGWYATDDAHPDARRAVQLGGHLSCLSVLGLAGLWLPPNAGLHVRFARGNRTARPAETGVSHCVGFGEESRRAGGPVDPVMIALTAAGRCTTPEYFVAILDSALHQDKCTVDEICDWLKPCPSAIRGLIDRTGVAESGTESLVRFRLDSARIRHRCQVSIAGVGRVDFLIGHRLVIEVDSRAHHTSPEAYARDRERDRILAALGYERIRVTWQEVMYHWDAVFADILAIIRRGEHLREPIPAAVSS